MSIPLRVNAEVCRTDKRKGSSALHALPFGAADSTPDQDERLGLQRNPPSLRPTPCFNAMTSLTCMEVCIDTREGDAADVTADYAYG
jgi:hypothetical protein